MSIFVYDAGALIAAGSAAARMREVHGWATALKELPLVPGPVLAQAWRGGPRAVRMARLLSECSVVTGYPEEVYRRAGRLLGAVDLPSGKRPDAVDALVVLTAAIRHAAAIVTSDPHDIAAYTSALDLKMEIIRV